MSSAVVRASGQQGKGALATMTSYWAFGIPLSYYFAYKLNLGVQGLWIGPTISVILITIFYQLIISSIDWRELFQEMDRRNQDEYSTGPSSFDSSILEDEEQCFGATSEERR